MAIIDKYLTSMLEKGGSDLHLAVDQPPKIRVSGDLVVLEDTVINGTDMEELDDNTEFHNYYLSLIVNNKREMVAKVAFRGDVGGYECLDEAGAPWNLRLKKARQVMFTFDCKISSPSFLVKTSKAFADRVMEVIKVCDEKRRVVAKQAAVHQPWKRDFPSAKKSVVPTFGNNSQWGKTTSKHTGFDTEKDEFVDFFSQNNVEDIEDMEQEIKVRDFTRNLLRLGEEVVENDTLDSVLEDIETMGVGTDYIQYTHKLLTMYPALFEKYWDIFGEIDTQSFIEITLEVTDVLLEYSYQYKICEDLITGLESMLDKM
jgi:hypothetical protein